MIFLKVNFFAQVGQFAKLMVTQAFYNITDHFSCQVFLRSSFLALLFATAPPQVNSFTMKLLNDTFIFYFQLNFLTPLIVYCARL